MSADLRERIARTIYTEGGYCGNCSYEGWDSCAECRTCLLGYADAVLGDLDLRQIGWMDPFAEVHSELTHEQCDPVPPCVPVFCIHIAGASSATRGEVGQ